MATRVAVHEWTEEQDQIIREAAMSYVEMGKLWGRSRASVHRRAHKFLGIRLRDPDWSPNQLETLEREWPNRSAAVIGIMIGKSRNAVVGKAKRLGLVAKKLPTNEEKLKSEPKPKPERKGTVTRVKTKPRPPAAIPEIRLFGDAPPLGIMELKKDNCRAIVGRDGRGLATYCGCTVYPGKSWCPHHCQAFYTEGNFL